MRFNIVCSGCRRRYSVEVPNVQGEQTVRCPYCSVPHVLTVQRVVRSAPVSGPAAVAAKVRRGEIASNVIWLILGVLQCVALYAAAAGVWNVINAIVALRNVKNIQPGNAGVVPYFDQRRTWLIVLAVVNIVLGGVVGVLLVLGEWSLREFVLRNRSAIEG